MIRRGAGWAMLCAAVLLCLACFGSKKKSPAATTSTRVAASSKHPVCLWIDWAGCGELLGEEARTLAFCKDVRAAGVTHLLVETTTATGEPALGPDRAEQLARLRRGVAGAGLSLGLVDSMFVGGGEHASWRGKYTADQPPTAGPSSEKSRLSPVDPQVQAQELARLRSAAMAVKNPDVILLAGFGFASGDDDVSPLARSRFESWSGLTARDWPQDVLGRHSQKLALEDRSTEARFAPNWTTWRAEELRGYLLNVRGALRGEPETRNAQLVVLVDGPYQGHLREGLNWAHPDAPVQGDFPQLPPDYASTAAGHLVDAIVLGLWEPGLLTAEDAEKQRYAWWASVQGSIFTGRRFLAEKTVLWAAVSLAEEGAWAPATAEARKRADGLVLFPASALLGEGSRFEMLRLALGEKPK